MSLTFEDIRRLALTLPEVEEGLFVRRSPSFEVRGKGFARFGPPIRDLGPPEDEDTLVIRVSREHRTALLTTSPDRFFITPHYELGEAVLTRLSSNGRRDLPELEDLLEEAWRRFAPKRLVAQWDTLHA